MTERMRKIDILEIRLEGEVGRRKQMYNTNLIYLFNI